MTLSASQCRECGDRRFPPPIVCVCGSQRFAEEPISGGVVEATTELAGSRVVLALVRTDGGLRIVARSETVLEEGMSVLIERRSTMIRAGSTEGEGV